MLPVADGTPQGDPTGTGDDAGMSAAVQARDRVWTLRRRRHVVLSRCQHPFGQGSHQGWPHVGQGARPPDAKAAAVCATRGSRWSRRAQGIAPWDTEA